MIKKVIYNSYLYSSFSKQNMTIHLFITTIFKIRVIQMYYYFVWTSKNKVTYAQTKRLVKWLFVCHSKCIVIVSLNCSPSILMCNIQWYFCYTNQLKKTWYKVHINPIFWYTFLKLGIGTQQMAYMSLRKSVYDRHARFSCRPYT